MVFIHFINTTNKADRHAHYRAKTYTVFNTCVGTILSGLPRIATVRNVSNVWKTNNMHAKCFTNLKKSVPHTNSQTHTRKHTHIHTYTHARTHARTHACTHARTNTHFYTHTPIHTPIRTHLHTHMHMHTRACARTHTPTHKHDMKFLVYAIVSFAMHLTSRSHQSRISRFNQPI